MQNGCSPPPCTAISALDPLATVVQETGIANEDYLTAETRNQWGFKSFPSSFTPSQEENFSFEDMVMEDDGSPPPLFIDAMEWPEDVCDEFIAGLPHKSGLLKAAAEEFGSPYLPDQKSVAAVETFWAKNDRKKRYLSHLRGNIFIACFIEGMIDAKTCVGMLRSIATEYGYVSLYNVAKMAADTVNAAEEANSPPQKFLCGSKKPLVR